jgi:NAD(P)-dependent dehydrogenase (short-subunit alcohol dehydrogenase family)
MPAASNAPVSNIASMKLDGAVSLITGVAGGIATATAEALARLGSDVVGIDIDREAGEGVISSVRRLGRRGLALAADLSDRKAVESAVEQTIRECGRIDILVNAVGIGGVAEIPGHDEALWDRIIAVNLKSIFLVCRSVLPHMMEKRRGRIVNITSRAAYRSSAGTAAYAASKGGLLAFSRVLAVEAGACGITVNNVAPGTTLTAMTSEYYGDPEERSERAAESGVLIAPPRFAEPREVAAAIAYLCGPDAAHITGSTLHVNGGSFMP